MSDNKEISNVDACIELAERFIKRAKNARGESYGACTAGMKRASLDLTRGLADLRLDGSFGNVFKNGKWTSVRLTRPARRWL